MELSKDKCLVCKDNYSPYGDSLCVSCRDKLVRWRGQEIDYRIKTRDNATLSEWETRERRYQKSVLSIDAITLEGWAFRREGKIGLEVQWDTPDVVSVWVAWSQQKPHADKHGAMEE